MKKNTDNTNKEVSRRQFLSNIADGGKILGLCYLNGSLLNSSHNLPVIKEKTISIKSVDSNFEREPLIRPFGFKGGYMTEKWQAAALLESFTGYREIGLCSTSVLWSDAKVFSSHSEPGGNALLFMMLEYALQKIKGVKFKNPIELLESIIPDVWEYGKKITRNSDLRKTFVLNSLTALDNAAWLLYAKENGFKSFDGMIPEKYIDGFFCKTDGIDKLIAMIKKQLK